MAYRCDPDPDFDRTPIFDGLGAAIIRIYLGVDFDEDLVIYMTLVFAPSTRGEGWYELRFGCEETRLSREDFTLGGPHYSIEVSKAYVPQEYRPKVLKLLLNAIGSMLTSIKPKAVTMQSFYGDLPQKAMAKYEKITMVMNAKGYATAEDFVGTGSRRYWLFYLETAS